MSIFTSRQTKQTTTNVEKILVSRLSPNPYCARRSTDRKSLQALAKSISQVGVLQPVLVRKTAVNRYQIVSGERRVKAARIAGLREVPCIVLGINERKSALFTIAENLQRDDVGAFEEAEGIAKMCDFYGMTVDDAAIRLGLSGEEIRDKLCLLRLSEDERRLCEEMKLLKSQLVRVARIPVKALRKEAIERIARGELDGDKVEQIGEIVENEKREKKSLAKNSAVLGNKSLFFKTINRAVEILNGAGGCAVLENIRTDKQTMIMITVENT